MSSSRNRYAFLSDVKWYVILSERSESKDPLFNSLSADKPQVPCLRRVLFTATAFSILVFRETGMLSGFFLKKKPPCTIYIRQHVNRKCSKVGKHKSTPARLSSAALLVVLALTACRSHDFPQYPPNYREYAYVTNGGSNTVTVLDVVNARVDREIPVGQNPVAVAVSPSLPEAYVVNAGADNGQGSLSIIDVEKNTVSATIPLHREPASIDLNAAGTLAYVTNSGANSVSIIDLKSRQEIAQIGAGEEPVAARLTPDGKTLVVANRRGNSVSIIDVAGRSVRAIFDNCPGASDVAILPDSTKAFIACSAGHQVMAVALADSKANPGQPDRLESFLDVGRAPVQLALKPDGGELFVSNSASDSISEVDTSKNDVGGAYLIGDGPVRGLVSGDNGVLYVANFRSQYVTAYSITDGKRLIPSIHVGDGPVALAFSDSGLLILVVDNRSADVAVVRTTTRSLFTILPTGRAPNAIAVKAFKVP
jgi:YVTN family beta-propeller protein